jgi:hypothetical protein
MFAWLIGGQYSDEVWRWLLVLFALVVLLLAVSIACLVAVHRHDAATREDTHRLDLRALWSRAESGSTLDQRESAWLQLFDAELEARAS